jgi:hypothetical protein
VLEIEGEIKRKELGLRKVGLVAVEALQSVHLLPRINGIPDHFSKVCISLAFMSAKC